MVDELLRTAIELDSLSSDWVTGVETLSPAVAFDSSSFSATIDVFLSCSSAVIRSALSPSFDSLLISLSPSRFFELVFAALLGASSSGLSSLFGVSLLLKTLTVISGWLFSSQLCLQQILSLAGEERRALLLQEKADLAL